MYICTYVCVYLFVRRTVDTLAIDTIAKWLPKRMKSQPSEKPKSSAKATSNERSVK